MTSGGIVVDARDKAEQTLLALDQLHTSEPGSLRQSDLVANHG
jgi:hypothetical protein